MQLINELPRTGKRNRNIFRKTYNRRPGNKQKRAFVMAKMGLSAVMGASQVHLITSQPIPKYYPEGSIGKGGLATVGESGPERFHLVGADSMLIGIPKPINL